MDGRAVREDIRERALALGFAEARFAPVEDNPAAAAALGAYLAEGRHGSMGWMADTAERRASPRALWPDARSVVVLGENYGPSMGAFAGMDNSSSGYVSVYARGRDYHDIVKKRLKALARQIVSIHGGDVKVFVDTAPLMEKPLAAKAGLGWQGRHTNLVSRRFGSWLFLGFVFTSLDLPPDEAEPDRCGRCRACESACPTEALTEGRIDPRRCISYLTIEHKGHIPHEFRDAMGNRIYGCDDCLSVCPWNRFAIPAWEGGYAARAPDAETLAELVMLDDAAFRARYAGSPVKRIGRDRFLRNVLIAIGNSDRTEMAEPAERLCGDASPLVRAAAVWALRKLLPAGGFERIAAERAASEQDPDVSAEWAVDGSRIPGTSV